MFCGSDMWSSLSDELTEVKVSENKKIVTYRNLPDNLYIALCESVRKYPYKTAVVDNYDHSTSFIELKNKVDSFSFYLKHCCHIVIGSHVGLMMYNSLEFCVALLSLIKIGAVAVILPTKYKKPEILSLLSKADPDFIICDKDYCSWFHSYDKSGIRVLVGSDGNDGYGFSSFVSKDEVPENTSSGSDNPAILIFTSGTTSQCKGVILRNYNIMHAIVTYKLIFHITENDVSVIPIPMYLVTGMVAILGLFIYAGGTVYLHKKFDAKRVLQCIKDHGVTFLHASPTVYSLILDQVSEYVPLPSLRQFACGSSNMPVRKIKELHNYFPQSSFHTVYGLTETSSPATIFPGDASVSPYIGSSGIPIPGLTFKIVCDDGSEASTGESGEILIRGTCVLDSYYKLDTPLFKDGWLDTGDIGHFNSDGYLYIESRKKDMINRGGEKITSYEVENELYQFEDVKDAAVVGIPDKLYGEVPAAVIVLKPGSHLNEQEITDALKERMAHYKIPHRFLFLDSLPQTPNGKPDKQYIRTLFLTNREGGKKL